MAKVCFIFPPVYLNKKTITVTISMQDQVHKLNDIDPGTSLVINLGFQVFQL